MGTRVARVNREPHFLVLYKVTSLLPETLMDSVPPFSCSLLAQRTQANGAFNPFFMRIACVHVCMPEETGGGHGCLALSLPAFLP